MDSGAVETLDLSEKENTRPMEDGGRKRSAVACMGKEEVKKRKVVATKLEGLDQENRKLGKATEGTAQEAKREAEKKEKEARKAEKARLKELEKETKAAEREAKAAEREAAAKEKEAKAKEKEAKAKDKEAKAAEREAKAAEREAEKEAKEVEKRQKLKEKEEAKAKERKQEEKKLRAQPKIANFFKTTPPAPKPAAERPVSTEGSDFQKCFLPFYMKPNVELAHAFARDQAAHEAARTAIDANLGTNPPCSIDNLCSLLHIPRRTRKRGCQFPCIRSLLNILNHPLTKNPQEILQRINTLPKKHLQFAEDIRPPYSGTFTRNSTIVSGRRPFGHDDGLDYDRLSELEWEQPGEGEELVSEEDEDSQVSDEELRDFLDDEEEEEHGSTRQRGELVPVSIGVCWDDAESMDEDLYAFRIRPLFGDVCFPIHPLAQMVADIAPVESLDQYFVTPGKPASKLSKSTSNGVAKKAKPPGKSTTHSKSAGVAEPLMPAFIAFVDGKEENANFMREILKKAFPKTTKEALKDRLNESAVRQNGKWIVHSSVKAKYGVV